MVYNGKPYEQMDDLGENTTPIFGNTPDRMIEVLEICVFFLGFVVFLKIFSTFFFVGQWVCNLLLSTFL